MIINSFIGLILSKNISHTYDVWGLEHGEMKEKVIL